MLFLLILPRASIANGRNNMPFEKAYVAIDLEPEKNIISESPLHVTITPPIALEDSNVPKVVDRLSKDIANLGLIEIEGEDEAEFGSSINPVRVRKIALSVLLSELHRKSMNVMEEFDPNIDETYARENWQPHSTSKDSIELGEGDKRIADHVVLLGKQNGGGGLVLLKYR